MPRHRAAPLDIDPTATDGALARQATAGNIGAFEELYRRHAQAAWRVAQSVTGNPEDASDAVSEAFAKVLKAVSARKLNDAERFRSYLLTATRNAALDVQRRRGRVRPTDAPEVFEAPSAGRGPSDAVEDGTDRDLVASAFRSLPERWRSVLWLTEVEGIPAREAAGMLGVSANGVAQLAVRARAGLRQRFLQAHLNGHDVDDTCKFTVERLGAYVAGGLSPRDLAKVDQHLAACAGCRLRREELEDLGGSLRKIVIPFPIGLAALSLGKWQAAAGIEAAATTGGAAGAGAAGSGDSTPSWMFKAQRPLAVASVALFAAGIVGAGVVGQSNPGPVIGRERDNAPVQEAAAPTVSFTPAAAFGAGTAGGPGRSGRASSGSDGARGSGTGADSGAGGGTGGGSELPRNVIDDDGPGTPPTPPSVTTTTVRPPTTTTTTSTTPPPPPPKGDVNLYVSTGTTTVSGAVGGNCTGGSVGTTTVGPCAPPPPPDNDYTVIVETPVARIEQ